MEPDLIIEHRNGGNFVYENGTKDSDIVAIITEMTDWKYTVETDYGKITNKGQTSFEYIKPKGQNEDNIIISVTNKENAKEYRTVISLFFIEPTGELTISFVSDGKFHVKAINRKLILHMF